MLTDSVGQECEMGTTQMDFFLLHMSGASARRLVGQGNLKLPLTRLMPGGRGDLKPNCHWGIYTPLLHWLVHPHGMAASQKLEFLHGGLELQVRVTCLSKSQAFPDSRGENMRR